MKMVAYKSFLFCVKNVTNSANHQSNYLLAKPKTHWQHSEGNIHLILIRQFSSREGDQTKVFFFFNDKNYMHVTNANLL